MTLYETQNSLILHLKVEFCTFMHASISYFMNDYYLKKLPNISTSHDAYTQYIEIC
jgi:hypothetical protein